MIRLKFILPTFIVALMFSCESTDQSVETSTPELTYDELIEKGEKYNEFGKIDEAIVVFNKAVKLDDKRIEAYYGLGYSYGANCKKFHLDCEKAITHYDKVLEIDSSYRHSLYNRANMNIELKQFKSALIDLNNELTFEMEDSDYFRNRTICYLNLGDTVMAHNNYLKAIDLIDTNRVEFMDQMFNDYFERKGKSEFSGSVNQ